VNHPRILGIGTANPPVRLTQEQSFHAAGYQGERIRKIFLNSDIDHRHFYFEGALNRGESSDQLNQRYLRGAMKTGCRAILNCLKAAGTTVQDVDFFAVCTCTGYVCPDVGSRLIAHMGFSKNLQRASIVGLGCAGALPTLQPHTCAFHVLCEWVVAATPLPSPVAISDSLFACRAPPPIAQPLLGLRDRENLQFDGPTHK
jgi:predicted naringenin-chalcone synthase